MNETVRGAEGRDAAVLVVGAGPVGLVAGCQLARLGVPVTVVDALEVPTTEARAVVIHARSLEMLAGLEVREEMEACGSRIGAMELGRGSDPEPQIRVDFGEIESRHPYVLDLSQPDTEEILARHAAQLGVVVHRGVRLTGLRQDDHGVTVDLHTPDGDGTTRYGWVVGADGGHSTLRHLLGTRLHGSFQGRHFAMADVDVDTTWSKDAIRLFPHPDGLGMIFPLPGDRARVLFMVDDPGAEELPAARVRALAESRTEGRVTVRDVRSQYYFEVHHGQVPQYRHGRVLLAGDAAHIHSPAGGQGMNTGIQDVANLAWKLALVARGRADPELLDSYHDERHPVGASVVRLTTIMTDVATGGGAVTALRELAMFVVGHVPPVQRAAATQLAELAVGYRDSALSVQEGHAPRGAARAGDRVPDPVGPHRADGTPVAVEDLLTRPGMLVLVRTDEPAIAADVRRELGDLGTVVRLTEAPPTGQDREDVLVDPDGALGRALGLEPGRMSVVRPDGYLGLAAAPATSGALRHYLVDTLRVRDTVPV